MQRFESSVHVEGNPLLKIVYILVQIRKACQQSKNWKQTEAQLPNVNVNFNFIFPFPKRHEDYEFPVRPRNFADQRL
jgi:hypothetical protein